ncbi:MAG: hypothetical protein KAG66_21840, partial [Methylococcales bacterium]|nr:hypothetical protein [Methylococcales bacterium]
MKKNILSATLLLLAALWLIPTGKAQDSTEKAVNGVKKAAETPEAKSILNNLRLRKMVRKVTENPENAASSIKENPDEAVRAATSLFQEQMDKSGKTVEDLKEKAGKAVEKLSTTTDAPAERKPAATEKPAIKRPATPP